VVDTYGRMNLLVVLHVEGCGSSDFEHFWFLFGSGWKSFMDFLRRLWWRWFVLNILF